MFGSFSLRALLLVLLSSPQHLQVTCLLGEELLRGAHEASGALLLDLVLLDQGRLLGLDDLLSRPGTSLRGPAETFSAAGAVEGGVTYFLGAAAGLDFLTAP